MRLVGIGAGGHALTLVEIARASGHALEGFVDADASLHGREWHGVPILGGDDALGELLSRGVRHAFMGMALLPGRRLRVKLFDRAREQGFEFPPLIAASVVVSSSAAVGAGAQILPGAVLNARVELGVDVLVNTGAVIEHECVIGDHAHVAPGATLAGAVQVGAQAHVGISAVVLQGVRIGARAVVGAGAVVLGDVPDGVTVVGNPARALEQ